MTDNIWTSYAERRPTKEDADYDACVFYLWSNGRVDRAWWAVSFDETPPDSWARTADVLRATGYVRPRKLHRAWRELREDSWDGFQWRWMLDGSGDGAVQLMYTKAGGAHHDGWTHWQPCDLPPVWEDET